MKDFDFDELDRAVSSVLTNAKGDAAKGPGGDTPPAEPSDDHSLTVTDQPPASDDAQTMAASDDNQASDDAIHDDLPEVPIVVHSPDSKTSDSPAADEAASDHDVTSTTEAAVHDEPANADVQPPVQADDVADDQPHDDTTPDAVADSDVASNDHDDSGQPAADPEPRVDMQLKRGRFMDVVRPPSGAPAEPKPMPVRSGVTISPSSDFSAEAPAPELDSEPVPISPPVTDEAQEPSTSEQIAVPGETQPTDKPDDLPATLEDVATPFIPDVPVEKRPLNAQATEPSSLVAVTDNPETDTKAEVVPTGDQAAAQTPREFAPDVMAVEANETIAAAPAGDNAAEAAPVEAVAGVSVAAPVVAAAAVVTNDTTDQESHPVFDANSYHQPLTATAHKSSRTLWLMIAILLFLVGAALGVLYFLYGQA